MSRRDPSQFTRIVEQRLGYDFADKTTLLEALTHKSYYHENREDAVGHNERLEFLGDSVVGLVVVEYLFRHKASYAESVLAKIKSYIVSEPVLSEIANVLSLGECILLGKGEKSTGGRTKRSILADAFEAVIGAVYLDGGFDRARGVVLGLFGPRIESAITSGQFFDYKTELQEKTQMSCGKLPDYRIISQSGEEHQRVFTVGVYLNGELLGMSSGRRKKEAETLAAKEALEKLQGQR